MAKVYGIIYDYQSMKVMVATGGTRRTRTGPGVFANLPRNTINLIGGSINGGETAAAALDRETGEEVGVNFQNLALAVDFTYDLTVPAPRWNNPHATENVHFLIYLVDSKTMRDVVSTAIVPPLVNNPADSAFTAVQAMNVKTAYARFCAEGNDWFAIGLSLLDIVDLHAPNAPLPYVVNARVP